MRFMRASRSARTAHARERADNSQRMSLTTGVANKSPGEGDHFAAKYRAMFGVNRNSGIQPHDEVDDAPEEAFDGADAIEAAERIACGLRNTQNVGP